MLILISTKNTSTVRGITLATHGIYLALWVATVVILFFSQQARLKADFNSDLSLLGGVVARDATAAITFDNKDAAEEILHTFQTKPDIVGACIRLPDGTEFAQYGRPPKMHNPGPPDGTFYFENEKEVLEKSITLDGERIGTLYLLADYRAGLNDLYRLYSGILAFALVASLVLMLFRFRKSSCMEDQPSKQPVVAIQSVGSTN